MRECVSVAWKSAGESPSKGSLLCSVEILTGGSQAGRRKNAKCALSQRNLSVSWRAGRVEIKLNLGGNVVTSLALGKGRGGWILSAPWNALQGFILSGPE